MKPNFPFNPEIFKILNLILSHPLNKGRKANSFFRFLLWQLFSRIYPYPILLPFTKKAEYLCWKGLSGLTGNWYNGLMEMEEMAFSVHFLREGDHFYDIGANVGAYSILASQETKCNVHSFEPHPETFQWLKRNINLQRIQGLVTAYNFGLGQENKVVRFSANLDCINHVLTNNEGNGIEVTVKILDDLKLPIPSLIKIDVEGFEYEVLKGSEKLLGDLTLKAIIIELNGSGKKYGIEDTFIDSYLRNYNFIPYTYDPFKRELIKLDSFLSHNTIYLRDYNFCTDRVKKGGIIELANGVSL